MSEWKAMVDKIKNPVHKVNIALVGKYVQLHDAYLSVVESLKHAGLSHSSDVCIKWIDSETVNESNSSEIFKDVDGILVPGGFGSRGIEGKILTAKYARENNIPYLGICLGMQIASIEVARNLLGHSDANSTEFNPSSDHPVISLMADQNDVDNLGGTLRLGNYDCHLEEGTLAKKLYQEDKIVERHRHRYEFNNEYREAMKEAGIVFSGLSPDKRLVEIIEIPSHPFYIACQYHPEFKSRPYKPHPLFVGLIAAALNNK